MTTALFLRHFPSPSVSFPEQGHQIACAVALINAPGAKRALYQQPHVSLGPRVPSIHMGRPSRSHNGDDANCSGYRAGPGAAVEIDSPHKGLRSVPGQVINLEAER